MGSLGAQGIRGDRCGCAPFRRPVSLLVVLLTIAATGNGSSVRGADEKGQKAATTVEAAKILDLQTFPLLDGAETPAQRRLAGLTYEAKSGLKAAFEFQKKKLLDLKWKELPGGYASDDAASGTFARDSFRVSVSVFGSGKPGMVNVMLLNHGNIDLSKLPKPPDCKSFYGGPVSTAYLTEAPVDKTTEAVRKLLTAKGWEPYGTAGDVQFFRQNAVRLLARVSSAPAQGGKTVIDYSSELLSAELPAPENLLSAQYSDSTKQLTFDTNASDEETFAFYREKLSKGGWKPTLEHPTKSGFKQFLIFVSPQKDVLTLETHTVDDKLRGELKHQSAAEIAELERLAKAAEARKKKAKENAPATPRLALPLPTGAQDLEQSKTRIEFKLNSGKALAAVETLKKQLAKEGWKAGDAVLEEMAGTIEFRKENQSITVLYVDPGLIPAEITITATGVELEVAKPEKK